MLRFAATHGFTIDRALAKTAERLSMGRLLSPPANMMASGHRLPRHVAAVRLDGAAAPSAEHDPRTPPLQWIGNLDASIVGDNAVQRRARAELELASFPGVLSTCALRVSK